MKRTSSGFPGLKGATGLPLARLAFLGPVLNGFTASGCSNGATRCWASKSAALGITESQRGAKNAWPLPKKSKTGISDPIQKFKPAQSLSKNETQIQSDYSDSRHQERPLQCPQPL